MAKEEAPRVDPEGPTPLKPYPLSPSQRKYQAEKEAAKFFGEMKIARRLTREPDEPLEDFVIRQKKEFLKAANEQRRRIKVLRRALKLKAIDDLELVKGNIPEFEPLIATWRVERLLRSCPMIGPTRCTYILQVASINAGRPVGKISYAKRVELARLVDEVRNAYGAY